MRLIAGHVTAWAFVGAKDGTERDRLLVVAKAVRRVDVVGLAVGFAEGAFEVFAEMLATPTSFGDQRGQIERRRTKRKEARRTVIGIGRRRSGRCGHLNIGVRFNRATMEMRLTNDGTGLGAMTMGISGM